MCFHVICWIYASVYSVFISTSDCVRCVARLIKRKSRVLFNRTAYTRVVVQHVCMYLSGYGSQSNTLCCAADSWTRRSIYMIWCCVYESVALHSVCALQSTYGSRMLKCVCVFSGKDCVVIVSIANCSNCWRIFEGCQWNASFIYNFFNNISFE